MKALRFAEFGPPLVLRIEEVAIPEPGEGEALIHVKAAAINPSDVGNVAGRFKNTTLPRTPGRDFVGIVVKGRSAKEKKSGGVPRVSVSPMTDLMRNMSLSHRKRCQSNRSP
jgi:NADPH:quinone reductase-like Zn-dependent oxidoreductase